VPDKARLFIIGAGGFGREIESWLMYEKLQDVSLAGYLDDNPAALNGYPSELKISGSPLSFEYTVNDRIIMGIAEPGLKEHIISRLEKRVSFYSLVSNKAVVGKFNQIGAGSVLCPGVVLTTNVSIGQFGTINAGTQIGHDVVIGPFASLMSNVDIGGNCSIGRNVYIGSGATVLPSVKIGDNAKIGAGSVVIKNVPPKVTVFGNPALKL